MSYELIEDLQEKAVTVSQACRTLEVSRSGYYAAAKRRSTAPVVCAASVHLKAAFAASGRTYGSRRLRAALDMSGVTMGRHRVRSLMRTNGLHPVWKRKFMHTTDSKHTMPVSPNVLARQFKKQQLNQAWVSDITYIRTRSGWLYLAAVLDLHSRKIVGWAMAPEMPATLVCTALQMAMVQRNPAAGLVVHSDQGTQLGFEESLQHHADRLQILLCSVPRPVFSNPASWAACHLAVAATASSSRSSYRLISVPLGKYWRSKPFVFSFVPRCHGLLGSQK